MMVANGLEGVPWMIGGNFAKHSANAGRLVAYAATGGQSGIIAPGDLKVSASSTADGQVHMAVGAAAIVNRSSNAQSESYMVRGVLVSDINISPTVGSARSDLVVIEIKDPQYGAQAPADVVNGPYGVPTVIPGVPSNTVRAEQLNLQKPLYAVARIDLLPNTSAITQSMIKDLRQPAHAHYLPANALQLGPSTPERVNVGDTAWKNFPSNTFSVSVPTWATHLDAEIELLGVLTNADANMDTRINFGGLLGPATQFDFNMPAYANGNAVVTQHSTQAVGVDVRSLAGQTVTFRLNAMRTFASEATGNIEIDARQQVKFRVEFFERPV